MIAPDPSAPLVPLVILSGFLGAGKTTVLNRVLGAEHHRRVAVLVNELGRIDIDAGLIRSRAGDVLELSGGCVCHQIGVQRELWSALGDIVRRSRPDIVVLETSGIAEPDAILEGLAALRGRAGRDRDRDGEVDDHDDDAAPPVEDPPVRASAVVTIVDAEAGARQLERHEEARAQVRAADRILLSKLDLVVASTSRDPATVVGELHGRLHELNPHAERSAFPEGATGTASLVSWLLSPGTRDGEVAGSRRRGPTAPHGHRHHARQLTATSFVDDAPLVAEGLLLLCASLGDRLIRAKGHIHLSGEPRRAFLERAGAHTRLELGAPWGDETPRTRLVLIGEELDDAALQRQLWACRA
jgi:G3E family GTPase